MMDALPPLLLAHGATTANAPCKMYVWLDTTHVHAIVVLAGCRARCGRPRDYASDARRTSPPLFTPTACLPVVVLGRACAANGLALSARTMSRNKCSMPWRPPLLPNPPPVPGSSPRSPADAAPCGGEAGGLGATPAPGRRDANVTPRVRAPGSWNMAAVAARPLLPPPPLLWLATW